MLHWTYYFISKLVRVQV